MPPSSVALNMQGQCFYRHVPRFFESTPCCDAARKVRKAPAEMGIVFLMQIGGVSMILIPSRAGTA